MIFSRGYFHADEHFQILEFLNARLGRSPLSELPIEFHQKMRPWLLPAFFAGVTEVLSWIGIRSPFALAFVYRLISSAVAFAGLAGLVLCAGPLLRAGAPRFRDSRWIDRIAPMFALLWYMPAFHARTSSENLGAAALAIGISAFFLGGAAWSPLIGFLFGVAFELRYQAGAMAAGAMLWILFFGGAEPRERASVFARMLGGAALGVLLGTLADRWGYGTWTFAPWNYFRFNILQGYLSIEDTSPWWDFFRRAWTESWPLLGFTLLALIFVAWIRRPRALLTWATLPLFLLHAAAGHKELRFLFPLISFGPLLIAHACEGWRWPAGAAWLRGAGVRRVAGAALGVLLFLNLTALITLTLIPAWMPIRFLEQLHEGAPSVIHYRGKDPFRVLGVPQYFYRPPGVESRGFERFGDLPAPGPAWVFHDGFVFPEAEAREAGWDCVRGISTLPSWIAETFPARLIQRVSNWSLFRCEGRAST